MLHYARGTNVKETFYHHHPPPMNLLGKSREFHQNLCPHLKLFVHYRKAQGITKYLGGGKTPFIFIACSRQYGGIIKHFFQQKIRHFFEPEHDNSWEENVSKIRERIQCQFLGLCSELLLLQGSPHQKPSFQ